MKKILSRCFALCAVVGMLWACDNGFSDDPIVDLPPKITLGPITSGQTEKQDFVVDVTFFDGVDNGTISSLASFTYTITKG